MVKVIVFILLLAVAGLGFYMHQNNLNPLSLEDINKAKVGIVEKGNKIGDAVTNPNIAPKKTTVYKRKDAKGNWYYSNEPPKPGEQAESITYSSDTNVLPPLPNENKKKQPEN